MDYVVYYSLGSVIFLITTIIYYFKNKGIPDNKTKVYKWMLFTALGAAIFDALSAHMEEYAMSFPRWIFYFTNGIFIFSMHTCLALFIVYLILLLNLKLSKFLRFLICTPYLLVIILILLSPFGKFAIFYIDDNHIYNTGATHIVIYIVTVIYMMLAVYLIFFVGKMIRRITKIALLGAIVLVLIMTFIQMRYPNYLLTASATALGVTTMYFILQLPSKFLDQKCSTYNRVAISQILSALYFDKVPFSIILVSIHNLNQKNPMHSASIDDEIICYVAKELKRLYPQTYICHLYYTDFVIISRRPLQEANFYQHELNVFPQHVEVDLLKITFQIGLNVLNGKDCENVTTTINIIDYIIYNGLNKPLEINVIDPSMIIKFKTLTSLSLNLHNYLNNDLLKLSYQAIYIANGARIGCEIIPYINNDKYQDISYNNLISAVKESNNILLFSETLLKEIVKKQELLCDYEYICIHIPLYFFNMENATDIIGCYLSSVSSIICFVFDERDYGEMSKMAFANLTALTNKGYRLIINNFGIGYTNNNTLLSLDLFALKVNKKELINNIGEKNYLTFLALVHRIAKRVNTHFMCSGIASLDEVKELREIGVNYYQSDEIIKLKK